MKIQVNPIGYTATVNGVKVRVRSHRAPGAIKTSQVLLEDGTRIGEIRSQRSRRISTTTVSVSGDCVPGERLGWLVDRYREARK